MKKSVMGILSAFLAGAATGALLGILLAPDKGSVTRANLKARGDELREDIKEGFEKIRNQFSGEEDEPVSKPRKKKPVRKAGAGSKKTAPVT